MYQDASLALIFTIFVRADGTGMLYKQVEKIQARPSNERYGEDT